MTAHDHTERVPGCFRCELSADEGVSSLLFEVEQLEAENRLLRERVDVLEFHIRQHHADKTTVDEDDELLWAQIGLTSDSAPLDELVRASEDADLYNRQTSARPGMKPIPEGRPS